MTDLHTLRDAFTELERRGDAAAAGRPAGLPTRGPARRPLARRLVPVTAAAAVVAGLATSVALLAPGEEPGTRAAAPATESTSAESTSTAPSTASPSSAVPTTPEELADRLRAVLGDTATFVVTETGAPIRITMPPAGGGSDEASSTPVGAALVGTLTASGVTGGFDLNMYPGNPGDEARCDQRTSCTVTELDDGSTLAVGTADIEGAAGSLTHNVVLVRPDGVTISMHVSNQRSPKGSSDRLAEQPPLTADELAAVVTSDRW